VWCQAVFEGGEIRGDSGVERLQGHPNAECKAVFVVTILGGLGRKRYGRELHETSGGGPYLERRGKISR